MVLDVMMPGTVSYTHLDVYKRQGLFNAVNLELARGIIGAAESMRAPVIIGLSLIHI